MRDAMAWATIAIFLAAGIWLLLDARNFQKRAVKSGEGLKFNPFGRCIKSESYVIVTRISGLVTIIVALVILLLMIRGN
jgi:hypothetical protein